MDLYNTTSQALAVQLTKRYSTSFSSASSLFPLLMRRDICSIYGLVRIADEIVDTYHGSDAETLLTELENDTFRAVQTGYSTNIIVQAFAVVARKYSFETSVITAFFASMRMDLQKPQAYTQKAYDTYIYGSAEAVGLLCLSVFCQGNASEYEKLKPAAQKLGAAYQKINFLRDLAADHRQLGRYYFPIATFDTFEEPTKQAIITDIQADLTAAFVGIRLLPAAAKPAVYVSYRYFSALLAKLQKTPAATIKTQRIRIPNAQKLAILTSGKIRAKVGAL